MGKTLNLLEIPVVFDKIIDSQKEGQSIARARTFYKYENRNGTYITDSFAEKLSKTIQYTPVKGIFSDGDFTNHGESRDEGRIYGIVPSETDCNPAWEKHLDKDGIEREYFCCDVFIYTDLYEEAKDIVGKSLSMELYPPSIVGGWKIVNSQQFYVFEDARFLGLQVLGQILGEDVEPCFEGASFYTLKDKIGELFQSIRELELKIEKNKGGTVKVDQLIYKLSDRQKESKLFSKLNPGEEYIYWIEDVYDEYFIAFNHRESKYYRFKYTKTDSEVEINEDEKKEVFAEFVSEEEKASLKAIRALNGETYEKIDEAFSNLKEEKENFEQKVEEQKEAISTLETEREEKTTEFEVLQESAKGLEEELTSLKEFKLEKELEAKEEVLNKFSNKVSEDAFKTIKEKINEFSIEELEKELSYVFVKEMKDDKKEEKPFDSFDKKDITKDGLSAYLENYVK